MMKKATRQQYASAAKARRQKQILAGLGVVLVAVLAIQGPKVLKMMSGSSSSPSTTTTTTSSTPGTTAQPGSSAAPMTATPALALGGVGLAALPSEVADASPPRTKSQIYSFEVFDSKNPFVQQVTTPTTPPTTAAPTPSASVPSAGAAPTPAPSAPAPNGKTSGGTTPPTASYTGSQPRTVLAVSTTGTALISVNGKSEMVAPGQAFPTSNPTFKLVSIANGTALIGLVGGTYASGSATVTLVQSQALTLLDTTDGVRYQLQLDALSAK
jgi:hypothetical protein